MVGHVDQVEDEVGPVTWNEGGHTKGPEVVARAHTTSPPAVGSPQICC